MPPPKPTRARRRQGVGAIGVRRRWLGPLLLTLLVLAFYAPVVLGRCFYLKDAQRVVYPTRLFLRERLLAFDLPEWLPHLDMGMPFLANPSNGVLYPLNLLLLLPAPYCVGWFVVVHALIAILGAWALLRALRLRAVAAALGATSFALGGYMVSLTWVPNYMMSLAWLPVVAWLVLRSQRNNRLEHAGYAGLVWAIQILCGEPHGVVLTAWFVVALVIAQPGCTTSFWRRLLLLGTSVGIACAVAMPQILPALELIPRSRRSAGIPLTEASHWSLHPLRLLELLVPELFGNPIHFDRFLGYFMDDEGSVMHRDPWLVSPYLGSLVLLFAIAGLVGPRSRHRRWVRVLGVLLLGSLLLALGRHTPFFAAFFRHVPGAALFRYPAKYFGLCAAILPLLGAAGFDAWLGYPLRRQYWYTLVGFALLLGVTALVAPWAGSKLHDLRPSIASTTATKTILEGLGIEAGLLVACVVALVYARHQPRRSVGPLLAVATLQIVRANVGAYATVPAQIYSEPALAKQLRAATPKGEPTRMMTDVAALDIAALDSAPGSVQAQAFTSALLKDIGIVYGIDYADSYISSEEGFKYEFWRTIGPYRRQMLDVFGIRHVVLPTEVPVPVESGLRRMSVSSPIGANLYENPSALPFAHAVGCMRAVDSQVAAAQALSDPQIALGLCGVAEGIDPGHEQATTAQRVGDCRLVAPVTDRLEIECELLRDGYVIVNESHHPNFGALLDGQATTLLRANAFVMATPMPAGKHRLVLMYREGSLLLASVTSLFAMAICVLLGLRARNR